MKGALRIILFVCMVMCQTLSIAQQIPQYSHYLLNGLLVNPAYAGHHEAYHAHVFYRNQWLESGTPQYLSFAIDGAVTQGVNLGFVFSNERMGSLVINNFSAIYAYRFPISSTSNLSFGLSIGAGHYGMSNLRPVDPSDPILQNLGNSWAPNVDIGAYYSSAVFYAGLSARNITNGRTFGWQEIDNFIISPSTWNSVLTLGFSLPLSERMKFRPSFMWQEDFTTPSHIDLTLALSYMERFWAGLSFRTDQNFWKPKAPGNINGLYFMAITAEIFIANQITLSYAYDFGLNQDSRIYFGGHEISLGFYFARKAEKRFTTPRYVRLRRCA